MLGIRDPGPGRLGVRIDQDLPPGGGLQVDKILADSPAGQAGLRVGDVIISVRGIVPDSVKSLKQLLSDLGAGREVEVAFRREDSDTGVWEEKTVRVTLGELRGR